MDVLMPQLGETVKEGTISAWYKQAGDVVAAGDALFEIETDKTAMEVQAIASGRLSEIRVKLGETVTVGSVIAVISDASGAAADARPAPAPVPPAPAPAALAPAPLKPAAPAAALNGHATPVTPPTVPRTHLDCFEEVKTPTQNYGSAKGPDGIRITPLARRLIAQNGIALDDVVSRVRAAGRSKVGSDDVNAALQARASAPVAARSTPQPQAGESVRFNRIRQQTGRHLAQSWQTAPHVFQAVEIDFTAVTKVRDAQKERFRQQHGAALSFLPFIARATCLAIAAFPQVNAVLTGDGLSVSSDVNLGIAVDLSHDGLVVPVIREAQGMTVAGLARAIHRLVETARAGRLTPAELEGGTYTISNNGSFGTLFTAPIINIPQVAILSTDAIRKKPVVMETEYGDVIVPRPVGVVAQSFDHRAFDGAYSASFLAKLKDVIERRDWAAEFG